MLSGLFQASSSGFKEGVGQDGMGVTVKGQHEGLILVVMGMFWVLTVSMSAP